MFSGVIDEVRFYNRALSADEVLDLFNKASPIANKIEIFQIWDYNKPANPNDLRHFFFTAVETDDTIALVEFFTPAGNTFQIRKQDHTDSNGIQTWHSVDNNTHLWGYEAEFNDVAELDNYGDGTYTFTVHYQDDSNDQTTVWFGIPGDTNAIPQPIQEPNLTFPPHNGSVTSPVTFQWEPCVDVNATSIYLWLENQDANDRRDINLPVDATNSGLVVLSEGIWEAQLCFDNLYDFNNADGIPVEAGKYSKSDYTFSVVNAAPVISSVTATPSTIFDNENSQLQVIASDPDTGPAALTYNWIVQAGEGSLNNTTIANPIYTPPDVNSMQTFTLAVQVSDGGDIDTRTITITVNNDSRPIAHWKMDDDAANTIVEDSSVYGNDGAAQQNTEDINTPGVIDGALTFNGSSDYVNINNLNGWSVVNDFTIAFWMKTTTTEDNGVFVGIGDNTDITTHFVLVRVLNRGRGLAIDISEGSGTDRHQTSDNYNLADGNWHYLTFKRAGSTTYIYVDGIEKSSQGGMDNTPNADNLKIMKHAVGTCAKSGTIDELMIFNRALSESEIVQLYSGAT